MPTMYKNKTYSDLNNYLKQQSPTIQQAQNYNNVYQPSPKPTQQSNVYNPNTDPMYKSYADQYKALGNAVAGDTLARASANTGGRANSYAIVASQQAGQEYAKRAADMIPQLAQYYRQNQESDREFNLKQAVTQANMTGYFNPYANTQIDPSLGQYSNDYQAEINRRRSINPNDPIIQQLEAARAQKIFSSPDLLQQYGEPYKTQDQRNADLARQIQQYNLQQMKDPNSPDNRRADLEISILENEAAFAPKFNQEKLLGMQADRALANQKNTQKTTPYKAGSAQPETILRDTTPQQQALYKEYENIFLNNPNSQYYNNPEKALDYLIKNKRNIVQAFASQGGNDYNKAVQLADALENQIREVTKVGYGSSQSYSNVFNAAKGYLSSKNYNPDMALSIIVNSDLSEEDAARIIEQLGLNTQ